MSERMGRDDLAEDLLPLAKRRDPGAAVPWAAVGEVVREAEALQGRGRLTSEIFAGLRRRALKLVSGLPAHRQAEALLSIDAMDPRRSE